MNGGCPLGRPRKEAESNEPAGMEPPGPGGPPLIGQAFNLDTDRLHVQFMEWQRRYGDLFMFSVFGKHYAVVSHPDILRQMFVTCEHARSFNDRPASFMGKYVIYKTKDIVFRNCDDKQQFLKCACLEYIETNLFENKVFYNDVRLDINDVISELSSHAGQEVNPLDILDRLTIRVMGLLLTGSRISEASEEFAALQGFMEAGNQLGTVRNQTLLTKLPFLRKVPGKLRDLYDQVADQRTRLRHVYLEDRQFDTGLIAMMRGLQADQEHMAPGDGTAGPEVAAWLNDDFLLGVIMDLTAAAIVPLKNTLSVLFLVFAHHPEVQDRVRGEMTSLDDVTDPCRVLGLPYARACMLEVKRFHTPLPISARHCNRVSAQFQQYTFPKNTEIFSNLFGIHHDERFWELPWNFRPERFLDTSGQILPADSPLMKNLVVTGVGPRRCVGATFSEHVMQLVATAVLHKFRMRPATEPLPECDPRKFLPGVVTRAPDLKCVFEPV